MASFQAKTGWEKYSENKNYRFVQFLLVVE